MEQDIEIYETHKNDVKVVEVRVPGLIFSAVAFKREGGGTELIFRGGMPKGENNGEHTEEGARKILKTVTEFRTGLCELIDWLHSDNKNPGKTQPPANT